MNTVDPHQPNSHLHSSILIAQQSRLASLSCGVGLELCFCPLQALYGVSHHMFLTIDNGIGDPMNFCKPMSDAGSD